MILSSIFKKFPRRAAEEKFCRMLTSSVKYAKIKNRVRQVRWYKDGFLSFFWHNYSDITGASREKRKEVDNMFTYEGIIATINVIVNIVAFAYKVINDRKNK